MTFDRSLLDLVACPACRGGLDADAAGSELTCGGCGLVYPVRDGIPVLLVERARDRAAG